MAEGDMNPADIAAVMGNSGLNGGNCWWFIILFFLICFGWGGNGFGPNGAANNAAAATDAAIAAQGGYVTSSQLNDALRMQGLQQGQRDITDSVNSNKYDITNALSATEARLTSNQSNLLANQAANAQAQQACCADVKYSSALNTSAINENVTAQSQRVLDAIAADRADRQAQRINDLQQQLATAQMQSAVQQATAGVVRYPMASTYNSGMNPFCGCGSGCCAA